MNNDARSAWTVASTAQRIVDDAYRAGFDIYQQQHVIEALLEGRPVGILNEASEPVAESCEQWRIADLGDPNDQGGWVCLDPAEVRRISGNIGVDARVIYDRDDHDDVSIEEPADGWQNATDAHLRGKTGAP